ncbi:hypothetical protein LJR129_005169 [Acidovorax sp. LjRoot129]|uniref:hypothetical protein n=1 Tax=Acidovorax sp. LjRoot129 TaxID=3342260 RepID=UPI003ECE10DF
MTTTAPLTSTTPDVRAHESLNNGCFCLTLDKDALERALGFEFAGLQLAELVRERCPFVFSARPVFVETSQARLMAEVIDAVESVVALPAYREQVLGAAPSIARLGAAGPRGVFFGYDFHIGKDRLGLIEINTNAGGAMLNAVLARAQRACCSVMDAMAPTLSDVDFFEERIASMFFQEWDLAGRERPLRSVAIVDQVPEQQYLYPEFLLFQRLFEEHGLRTVIVSPTDLTWRGGVLWAGDLAIDLVYNRLTDFYLEEPGSEALREAHIQDGVVLTPNPHAHALYADKRNLALFSDALRMSALGVPDATQKILLEHVPHTEVVMPEDAQRLWEGRRSLFFKPVAGFGSRAAYRGDKLTKRVWGEILAGEYVAQALVTPGERRVNADGAGQTMKFDMRAYTYEGSVMWLAARLYQGQTTNFRTVDGGFAPVYSGPMVSAFSASLPSGVSSDDSGQIGNPICGC